ncbi:MAG: SLC13/DASS family transporter [Bacteroidetes bacterium]|nr:SLC13/DASS family transporter [Bacteroidota bacterium]
MSHKPDKSSVNYLNILIGIAGFVLTALFLKANHVANEISFTAAIAVLMAVWWVTEAIPIGVTSLLPIVLFPLFGILDGKAISNAYINYIIFLFIGGFIMALAIEKWELHKRIALRILSIAGGSPFRILSGFMFASWILSMWMSNTATAMMMLPIAISISAVLENVYSAQKVKSFNIGIFLGIAYACSIGGIATLVGTPPNLSFVRIFNIIFPQAPEITFAQWLLFALPLSISVFMSAVFLIYLIYKPKEKIESLSRNFFMDQYRQLGPITTEQKRVFLLFIILILLWIFRNPLDIGFLLIPGWSQIFHKPELLNDGTVAIFLALLLFIIPSSQKGQALVNWEITRKIPWQIVFLFGGGFALAKGFIDSGLSAFIGDQLLVAGKLPSFVLIGSLTSIMTFLTEFTSNTATTEMLLPVVAGLAVSIKVHPLVLMLPITLAASMAFMFPVATPPNAIVFGSGRIDMMHMLKTGIFLNIIAIILITLYTLFWADVILPFDKNIFPSWAG